MAIFGVARPGGRHRHRYHGALALGLDRHRWALRPGVRALALAPPHSLDRHPNPAGASPNAPSRPCHYLITDRPVRRNSTGCNTALNFLILSQVNMSQILCDVCHIFSSLILSKMQLRAVRRAARKISVHTPDQVGAHAVMSKNLDDVPRPLRFSVSFVAVAALLLGTLSRRHHVDPFAAVLPQRDFAAPEGMRASGGDATVSDTQGAELLVADPGAARAQRRAAEAGALVLLRRSAARRDRGGLLPDLPTIERDPQYPSTLVYRLRGLGDDQRLVRVTGDGTAVAGVTQYRPELDTSFTRVTEQAKAWTVRTPDGMTRLFEANSAASDLATRWNLTRERDARSATRSSTHGVATPARRATSTSRCRRSSTPRTRLQARPARARRAHLRTDETCRDSAVPAGARTDHHFGFKRLFGARILKEVVTSVRDGQQTGWRVVTRHRLGYDSSTLSCSATQRPCAT